MKSGWLVTCVFIATTGAALLALPIPEIAKAFIQGGVQAAIYWKGLHEKVPERRSEDGQVTSKTDVG